MILYLITICIFFVLFYYFLRQELKAHSYTPELFRWGFISVLYSFGDDSSMIRFTSKSLYFITLFLGLKKAKIQLQFIAVSLFIRSFVVCILSVFFIYDVDLGLKCRRRLQNFNVCPDKSKYSRLNRDTLFTEFRHTCSRNWEWPSPQASRPHWAP